MKKKCIECIKKEEVITLLNNIEKELISHAIVPNFNKKKLVRKNIDHRKIVLFILNEKIRMGFEHEK